jgi:HK97 family phage major capsid protein
MDDLTNMREQRDSATAELEKLAKIDDRSLTSEECDKYENLEKHIDDLDTEIRSERIKGKIGDRLNQPASFSMGAEARPAQDQWGECLKYWRSCGRDEPEIRTMNTTDDADTVPTDLLDELVQLMGAVSGVRQAVDVRSYANGVEIPRVATRISVTATTAEGAGFTATEPTFDKVDFSTALTATATTELTVQLMQDARPDLVREVLTQHAEELSRFWGSSYCNGLGAADADTDGIFSAVDPTGLNVLTAASAGSILAAELIELRYSTLPAKYWTQGGNLSWLMGQDTFAAVMGLLDNTTGRPIFQAAAEATMANALQGTILGLPVFIDSGAPALATGNKTVALISRDAYRIADRDPGLVSNINPWAQQSTGIVEVNSYYRSCGRWMRPQSAAIIEQP